MSDEPRTDARFLSMILAYNAATLQHLGKIASPVTGKVERDMDAARQSIELLECLAAKTTGNLSDEEGRTLEQILTTLRLNFVDEIGKAQAASAGTATADAGGGEAAGDGGGEPDEGGGAESGGEPDEGAEPDGGDAGAAGEKPGTGN